MVQYVHGCWQQLVCTWRILLLRKPMSIGILYNCPQEDWATRYLWEDDGPKGVRIGVRGQELKAIGNSMLGEAWHWWYFLGIRKCLKWREWKAAQNVEYVLIGCSTGCESLNVICYAVYLPWSLQLGPEWDTSTDQSSFSQKSPAI